MIFSLILVSICIETPRVESTIRSNTIPSHTTITEDAILLIIGKRCVQQKLDSSTFVGGVISG